MTEHLSDDAILHEYQWLEAKESRDVAATRIFEDVFNTSVRLNFGPPLTGDQRKDAIRKLNESFDAAGFYEKIAIISGKLRPIESIDDEDDEDRRETEHQSNDTIVADAQTTDTDQGELKTDERGNFHIVVGGEFECGKLYLEKIQSAHSDRDIYDIRLRLFTPGSGEDDDENDEGYFISVDEILAFTPEEASDEHVEHILKTVYPQVFEQIQTLPHESEDDTAVINALHDFALMIDLSEYPRISDGEINTLVDYIDRYITARVELDDCHFKFKVRGEIYSEDIQGKIVDKLFDTPRTFTGTIHKIHIHQVESEANQSSQKRLYHLLMECFVSSHERGGGYNRVFVPFASLIRAKNIRNNPLFDDVLQEIDSPLDDIDIMPVEANSYEGILTNVDPAVFEHDDRGAYYEPAVNTRELIANHEAVKTFFDQAHKITSASYKSLEAAASAQNKLISLVTEFEEWYATREPFAMTIKGIGLFAMDPRLNQTKTQSSEEGALHIVYDGAILQPSDLFTQKTGYYGMGSLPSMYAADDGTYKVRALLFMNDVEQIEPAVVYYEGTTTPIMTAMPEHRFIIHLDDYEVDVSLGDYERNQRCKKAIEAVKHSFPDYESLPTQLTALHEMLENSTDDGYIDLDNIALLHTIGETVGGDSEANEMTSEALTEILIQKQIYLSGALYNQAGVPHEKRAIAGIVKGVVSTTEQVLDQEPLIIIADPTDNRILWYAPLTTIEKLMY